MSEQEKFSYKLPTTRIMKWFEKDGKNHGCSFEVEVYNRVVTLTVNSDVINWKVENLQKVHIGMDTALFIFNLLKESTDTLKENEKISIPIIKAIKNDKGKPTGETMKVADILYSRNDKEYFIGLIFPQQKNIKFIFQPPVPTKQWYIAKNDTTVDTVILSRVQAKTYFTRVIEGLRVAEASYLKKFNSNVKVKQDKSISKTSVTHDGSVAIEVTEPDMSDFTV